MAHLHERDLHEEIEHRNALVAFRRERTAIDPVAVAESIIAQNTQELMIARKTIAEQPTQPTDDRTQELQAQLESILEDGSEVQSAEVAKIAQALSKNDLEVVVSRYLKAQLIAEARTFVETEAQAMGQGERFLKWAFGNETLSFAKDWQDLKIPRISETGAFASSWLNRGDRWGVSALNGGITLIEGFLNRLKTKVGVRMALGLGLVGGAAVTAPLSLSAAGLFLGARVGMAAAGSMMASEVAMTRGAIHKATGSKKKPQGLWNRVKGMFGAPQMDTTELTETLQSAGTANEAFGSTVATIAAAHGELRKTGQGLAGSNEHQAALNHIVDQVTREKTAEFMKRAAQQPDLNRATSLVDFKDEVRQDFNTENLARLSGAKRSAQGRFVKAGLVGALTGSVVANMAAIRSFLDETVGSLIVHTESGANDLAGDVFKSMSSPADAATLESHIAGGQDALQLAATELPASDGAFAGIREQNYALWREKVYGSLQETLEEAAKHNGELPNSWKLGQDVQLYDAAGNLKDFQGYEFSPKVQAILKAHAAELAKDPEQLYKLLSLQGSELEALDENLSSIDSAFATKPALPQVDGTGTFTADEAQAPSLDEPITLTDPTSGPVDQAQPTTPFNPADIQSGRGGFTHTEVPATAAVTPETLAPQPPEAAPTHQQGGTFTADAAPDQTAPVDDADTKRPGFATVERAADFDTDQRRQLTKLMANSEQFARSLGVSDNAEQVLDKIRAADAMGDPLNVTNVKQVADGTRWIEVAVDSDVVKVQVDSVGNVVDAAARFRSDLPAAATSYYRPLDIGDSLFDRPVSGPPLLDGSESAPQPVIQEAPEPPIKPAPTPTKEPTPVTPSVTPAPQPTPEPTTPAPLPTPEDVKPPATPFEAEPPAPAAPAATPAEPVRSEPQELEAVPQKPAAPVPADSGAQTEQPVAPAQPKIYESPYRQDRTDEYELESSSDRPQAIPIPKSQ